MTSNTEAVLNDAVMGDADAIQQIARRLDGTSTEVVAAVREQLRFEAAANEFQRNYSDIWNDPQLKRLALARDSELANLQPELSYSTRLELVGSELRDWARKLSGGRKSVGQAQKEQPAARDPADRRPAVTTIWEEDGGEGEEDASSVIQKLAESRGQSRASIPLWKIGKG